MEREVRSSRLPALAGYAVAAACLVWLFHDVHPGAILSAAGRIEWPWIAVAVFFDVLSYVTQGWRWNLLLRGNGRIGVLRATQAIYAGLFTNEILPMRAGELLRTALVARWTGRPMRAVLPSLAVERLMDGLWLALAIGLTAVFVPLPRELRGGADVLAIAVLGAAALFVFLLYRKRGETAGRSRLGRALAPIEDGLREIGTGRRFWFALAVSLLLLAAQVLAFWFVMVACGMELSLWAGAVVLLIVHLGTAIPNAPANIGTYQFSVVVGLSLFGVDKAAATGFAFVVFTILTVPLWLIGGFAFSRSGAATLGQIRGLRRAPGTAAPAGAA